MEAVVRSIPVYYEEYGEGIPILMLHGGPSDNRQMIYEFEPLFQNRGGWRRLYPDMPGMGKTPGAEWITTNDQMLEIVTEFMQIVAPNQRFVVAGVSYGGYLARGLVYQQGDRIDGVNLLVPLGEPDPAKRHLPAHQVLVEDAQFQAALEPEERVFGDLIVAQSLEILEWLRIYPLPSLAAANHAFWYKLWEHFDFSFPLDQLTNPFPAPTLILTGRQDSVSGYKNLWGILDNYPRGTLAVLDRAGHGLLGEQKVLFQTLTNEWLNRVEEYIAQRVTKVTG